MIKQKLLKQSSFTLPRLAFALMVSACAPQTSGAGDSDFGAHCSRCHSAAELRTLLIEKWNGRSAAELFSIISTTMPAELPGSLSESQYLAITDYVLGLGDSPRPAGKLSIERLAGIQIAATESKDVGLPDVPWNNFGGNLNANRYAKLNDINRENVAGLEIAWRWSTANFGPEPELRNVSMPIMRHGKLYLGAGATRNVVALDAATGQVLCFGDPGRAHALRKPHAKIQERACLSGRAPMAAAGS